MKTKKNITPHEIYFSSNTRLKAAVSEINDSIFVEFYKDGVMLELRDCSDHSSHYAHSIAENYCDGILRIENKFF